MGVNSDKWTYEATLVCYVTAVYSRRVSLGLLSVSLGCLVKRLRVKASRWASIYLQAAFSHL